tara:strand:- start:737 stop:1246 length:510 start_codon:yes stop_codon:yes gene_type:complete
MTAEDNFKNLCDLTTSVLGFAKGSLATRSRKRPLQVARAVAGVIARTEEDIHHKVIGKVLNRDRSLIYHYEHTHQGNYATCAIYRNTFNLIYKAYKDLGGEKDFFLNGDFMKSHLLKNGVKEKLDFNVVIEVKSAKATCKIKTTLFDFSNQLKNINLALKNYHFTVNII